MVPATIFAPVPLGESNIVTYGPTARQRPQHTRNQQYWSSVFFVSEHEMLLCNARAHLACAVTSHKNRQRSRDMCFLCGPRHETV
jgi:hypothetical protein